MKSLIRTFAILVITGYSASAQNHNKSYQAYLSSLTSLWESDVASQQTAYDQSQSSEALFNLALSQFGLLNNTMVTADQALFDKYVDAVDDNLDELIELKYKPSESMAIQSAVIGLKIAYSNWKGMFLGAKSGSLIDEALEGNPNSAIVRKLHANYLYFTPEAFGGDKELAVSEYKKAIELFEKSDTKNNWLYLDAMAWLGVALSAQEKKEEAREVYQKALSIERDFNWVKYELLPQIQ